MTGMRVDRGLRPRSKFLDVRGAHLPTPREVQKPWNWHGPERCQFLATEVSRDFGPPCPARISPAQAAALGPATGRRRGTLATNSMVSTEQIMCQTRAGLGYGVSASTGVGALPGRAACNIFHGSPVSALRRRHGDCRVFGAGCTICNHLDVVGSQSFANRMRG